MQSKTLFLTILDLQSGANSIGEMAAILDFALFNYRVLTDKYSAN